MKPEELRERSFEFARAMDRGDIAALDRLTAPTFVYRPMITAPGFAQEIDRDTFVNKLPKIAHEMVPDGFGFVCGTTIVEGPHVAMQATGDATTADGRKYANTYHWYFHFDGDKIDEFREYMDVHVAMSAFDPNSWTSAG